MHAYASGEYAQQIEQAEAEDRSGLPYVMDLDS